MKSTLPQPAEWHKRYDNIDGTGEMLMGFMLASFGVLGHLQASLPKDSIWRTNAFAGLIFMYAVLAAAMAPAYLLRWFIKRRFTFPRTGYVAMGVGGHHYGAKGEAGIAGTVRKSYWLFIMGFGLIIGAVAAGIACVVAIQQRHGGTSLLATLGYAGYLGMWVPLYAFWIWKMGQAHRWKWLLLGVMAAGLLLIGIFGPGNFVEGARPVTLFVGGVWVVSGLATLLAYLRRTQQLNGEAE